MSKVTYLIGAGASCKTLPLVSNFPAFIESLINHLNNYENRLSTSEYFKTLDTKKTKKEYQDELIDSFKWILKESRRHASIDTYAKKLFLKNEIQKLEKLKHCLSFYFILEQARYGLDLRYDAFFASILSNLDNLPKEIKIISWNYDYQIELAFSDYIESKKLTDLYSKLNIQSKFINNDVENGFTVFKLNGTSALKDEAGKETLIDALPQKLNKELLENIVLKHNAVNTYYNDYKSLLSFSWEEESTEMSIIDHTVRHTTETEYLVIIGYSFPFFNRDIDRLLISSMGHLKKVYFQDLYPEMVMDRFKSIRDNIPSKNLIPVKNTDQFYLPPEL